MIITTIIADDDYYDEDYGGGGGGASPKHPRYPRRKEATPKPQSKTVKPAPSKKKAAATARSTISPEWYFELAGNADQW
jgi:hypothetical protein